MYLIIFTDYFWILPQYRYSNITIECECYTYILMRSRAISVLPQVVASWRGVVYRGNTHWVTSSPILILICTSCIFPAITASFIFRDIFVYVWISFLQKNQCVHILLDDSSRSISKCLAGKIDSFLKILF